jgi:hypothetical protein
MMLWKMLQSDAEPEDGGMEDAPQSEVELEDGVMEDAPQGEVGVGDGDDVGDGDYIPA